ncbi:hypothetical protein Nepgr_015769 [Nepenthes gracilis]|uniref:B box-type domain-containing protein n=1 Tax=Nepenthes gracilis TaxID=150966 RepID=A0AAD3SMB4_NEPGR|nr:hypothetical protein Nepgr_015769 [Nepenthes gracilis]
MKIQCDVCGKEAASVFCSADEAALCCACDQRVHHANKLASKHQRLPFLVPFASGVPLCDICQERKALLFCQQDRAILCRDCDIPIHTENDHTQRHNRFLLTGIKLSPSSALSYSTTIDAAAAVKSATEVTASCHGCDPLPDFKRRPLTAKKPVLVSSAIATSCLNINPQTSNTGALHDMSNLLLNDGGGSTSSISEYLLETLPGWQVEDFLDSASAPFGVCKGGDDDDLLSLLDVGLDHPFSSLENSGVWVPQAPVVFHPTAYNSTTDELNGLGASEASRKDSRKWKDDSATVPQSCPQSVGSKRSRPFW